MLFTVRLQLRFFKSFIAQFKALEQSWTTASAKDRPRITLQHSAMSDHARHERDTIANLVQQLNDPLTTAEWQAIQGAVHVELAKLPAAQAGQAAGQAAIANFNTPLPPNTAVHPVDMTHPGMDLRRPREYAEDDNSEEGKWRTPKRRKHAEI